MRFGGSISPSIEYDHIIGALSQNKGNSRCEKQKISLKTSVTPTINNLHNSASGTKRESLDTFFFSYPS